MQNSQNFKFFFIGKTEWKLYVKTLHFNENFIRKNMKFSKQNILHCKQKQKNQIQNTKI